jgi:hypothetical protein
MIVEYKFLFCIIKKILMSGKIVLGYWGVRGKAQVLRHLLSYLEIPF